jgi:7,8-dihydropterin-6-yl-methyl-4-(beta-D-ribofuranosyl)aminobenzene 5'-phosphate synthase
MRATLTRRQILFGSAALALPWSISRQAPAAEPGGTLSPPAVDRLSITVIVDSSYDTPRASGSNWVKVRRVGLSSPNDYRRTLHNEWGLALALESQLGADTRRYLLDFGYTVEALTNNMEITGVDPTRVSTYILSHGHYDHFGGLIPYLQKNRDRLPADIALYVGGEDAFCRRLAPGKDSLSEFGVLDRRDLAALKVRVVSCPTPTVVADQAFTTGVIARTSFERVLPNTLVEYAMKDGVGCDIPDAALRAQGKPVADEHLAEHATCFNIKDRGLVVISSCGHRGIVNSVHQAIKVSGITKVHAIVGGFHLFPADEAYVKQTVAELRSLNPDVLIPMHCSGPGLATALREQMPAQFVASTTGTQYTFGA